MGRAGGGVSFLPLSIIKFTNAVGQLMASVLLYISTLCVVSAQSCGDCVSLLSTRKPYLVRRAVIDNEIKIISAHFI